MTYLEGSPGESIFSLKKIMATQLRSSVIRLTMNSCIPLYTKVFYSQICVQLFNSNRKMILRIPAKSTLEQL